MIFLINRFIWVTTLICFFPFLGLTQNSNQEIKALVLQLFDGMRQSDTTMMSSCFHENCMMFTTLSKGDKSRLISEDVKGFIASVGKEHDEVYDERLGEYTLNVDDVLASMEVKYYFFLDDKFSHCGTNFFTFFKDNGAWKIISIADTRSRENCDLPETTW
jgi:hypothetical protein